MLSLGLLTVLVIAVDFSPAEQCNAIDVLYRIDCGSLNSTSISCATKNCCWDPLKNSPNTQDYYRYPACYRSDNVNRPTCMVGMSERVDCGNGTTSSNECVAKGCCWNVLPNAMNGIYCFYPSDSPTMLAASLGPDKSSSNSVAAVSKDLSSSEYDRKEISYILALVFGTFFL